MIEPQAAQDDAAQARIHRFLREIGIDASTALVLALAGDASNRRYFRVLPPEGRSIVLALHAGPIDFASLPFANVARLFDAVPLPAPRILGHSDPLGLVALEDLGDVTLQAYLETAADDERTRLYVEAASLIERLQRRGTELAASGAAPYSLAFDIEKLTWELDFFVQHFLEGYRGLVLTEEHRAVLDEEWLAIAADLASEPRVLCHRDYHSRNLMVHDGRLFVIDFQDARMGPDTYDLASLLRDSYVELPASDVEALIRWFAASRGHADLDAFRRRFDLMSLQRNLKALGTFGNQAHARGNPAYVADMPRTLRYVRTNLHAYPRFDRLRRVLAAHVAELR
ncbi:MAG: phosphotransferase [Acidobacteriota bacterium]